MSRDLTDHPIYDTHGDKLGYAFWDTRYRRWGIKQPKKPPIKPQYHDAEEAAVALREMGL